MDSSYQPACVCPPTPTSLYCQTTISSGLSGSCLYNGTCDSNAQETSYTCTCSALYKGARCENLINRCLPNRCIFSRCYILNNGTYYCAFTPTLFVIIRLINEHYFHGKIFIF